MKASNNKTFSTRLVSFLLISHCVLLSTVILNSLSRRLISFDLINEVEIVVQIVTVTSGLLLFFIYLKPFRKRNFYFMCYPTVLVFTTLAWISKSFILVLFLSIIFILLGHDDNKIKEDGIIISTQFQGIMAPCCHYQIKEKKMLIFEKQLSDLNLSEEGPFELKTIRIINNQKEITIKYRTSFDPEVQRIRTFKRN